MDSEQRAATFPSSVRLGPASYLLIRWVLEIPPRADYHGSFPEASRFSSHAKCLPSIAPSCSPPKESMRHSTGCHAKWAGLNQARPNTRPFRKRPNREKTRGKERKWQRGRPAPTKGNMGETTSKFPLLVWPAEIPYLRIRVTLLENVMPGLCFLRPPILFRRGARPYLCAATFSL